MRLFLSILFIYLLLYCVGCKTPNPRGIAFDGRNDIKDKLAEAIKDKTDADEAFILEQELKGEIKKAEKEEAKR